MAQRNTFALLFASIFALTSSSLTGCAALYPHRLDDTLANYHDDLRWGRTQVAERSVQQSMRAEWSRRHAAWAERIRIVDMEVEQPRTRDGATYVRANFVWNFADEMETRETTVETRWVAGATNWSCDEELVIAGDRALLSASASANGGAQAAPSSSSVGATGATQHPSQSMNGAHSALPQE